MEAIDRDLREFWIRGSVLDKIFCDRANPFDVLSDAEFRRKYRFSRKAFFELLDTFKYQLSKPTNRGKALLPVQRLGIALEVLASNSFQGTTAEVSGCSRSTVCRIVHEVSSMIVRNVDDFVYWPSDSDRIRIHAEFRAISGIPVVIGCVDGTHVKIIAPTFNEHMYVNRKGFHSINLGLMCDSTLRFIWFSARFPGSAHDSRVSRESARIQKFSNLLLENKKAISDAIFADLHRAGESELDMVVKMVKETLQKLQQWNQPSKVELPEESSLSAGDEVFIVPESLGVVLVIGPWNFPLATISPLVHAFSAGNTVVLKPSELNPVTSRLLAELIANYFDEAEFCCIEGGVSETTELLKERFDHILYTGCPPVGKIVMAAAAKHLTPVTLELGGKNPVFVDESADLVVMARAILKAKLTNCGQICVSTDYLLVTPVMKSKVVGAICAAFDQLGDLKACPMYARIVNERHFKRLTEILTKSKGKVIYKTAQEADAQEKFMPFQIVEIEAEDELMKEEIFGPILPVLTVDSFDAALDFLKQHEKPLASYLFTQCPEQAKRWVLESTSGGVSINDTFAHMTGNVPFGGVGNSGMGAIHGKFGFDTFTHYKAVAIRNGVHPDLNRE